MQLEAFVTQGGAYVSGVVPEIEDLFQRQAWELDRKKREALLAQIQEMARDRVMYLPIYEYPIFHGVGPRVEVSGEAHQGVSVSGAARGSSEADPCALGSLLD